MRKTLMGMTIAGAILLSGCSASPDSESTPPAAGGDDALCGTSEEVTLRWQNWISQEEGSKEFSEAAVAAFEAACPNITVEVVGVPAEETADQLALAARSQTGPDVFQTQTFWTAQFTALGLFRPIETLDDLKADMVPAAVESGTYDGQWVNPVWGLAPFFLTYNKNVLAESGLGPEEAPATWDELFELSATVGQAGEGSTFGYCQDAGQTYLNGFWSLNMLFSYGAELYKDGKANIDSPEVRDAFEDYQAWYQEPGAWAQGIDVRQCRDLFATNRVAYNFESSWATGIYRAQSGEGEAFDDQWGTVPVPVGPSGRGVAADANQGLAVAAYTENPEAAEAFIRFMISDPDVTAAYLEAVGFPSPVQSLWDSPVYDDPIVQVVLEAAPNSQSFTHPRYTELSTALGTALQEVANGADVDEQILQLQAVFAENE